MLERSLLRLATLALFTSLAACSTAVDGEPEEDPASIDDALTLAPATCPNMDAFSIHFMASKTSAHAGFGKITGYIKNVGNATLTAGSKQAYARLYEINVGQAPVLVKELPITNAPPGSIPTVNNLAYTRPWNTLGPEGKNPPKYRLVFWKAPGVVECVAANNARERSGADMNALF